MSELSLEIESGPGRAIPVLPSFFDQTLLSGSGKLFGWSLADVSGDTPFDVAGNVVAPAANAVIVSQANIPTGVYTVRWNVGLQGAAAAADADNFALQLNGVTQMISDNPGVAGEWQQQEADLNISGAATVRVIAIGAGTAGVTYTAQIEIVPPARPVTSSQLLDAGNTLGAVTILEGGSSTAWFGPQGIRIYNQIKFHPLAGIMAGAVYALFDRELTWQRVSMSSA